MCVCVRVRAPWCRACKGLEPKYKQVAHKYPKAISFKQLNWEVDTQRALRWRLNRAIKHFSLTPAHLRHFSLTPHATLEKQDNRDFCKTIGVTALPLVKFFTADGEVPPHPILSPKRSY